MSTLRAVPAQPARLRDLVAAEVRAQLARQRITQQELAAATGLSQASISERLRGKTPFTTDDLERISEALGVHPAVLVGGTSGYSPEPAQRNTDWFDQTFDTQSCDDLTGIGLGSESASDADLGMNAPVAA